MKEYLTMLRQTQEFHNLKEWVEKQAPEVPGHVVDPDNTEVWKAQSHEKDGFDQCVKIIFGVYK